MSKNKNVEINLEEKLEQSLISVKEQPYKIPNNWIWTRLGEIVVLDNGENIENEELDYFDVKTLRGSKEIEKKNSGKVVEKNDLVILVDGENSGEVFKIQYRGYMGSTFKKLKYKKEEMWNYISMFLRKNREVFKNSKVGSAIPHLNKKLFKEIEFPLPPLNEQKRIVEKLDFLFDKTKKAKEIIEEIKVDIENRKISVLDRAFKGVLTSKWRDENKVTDVKELLKSINEEKIKKWEEECLLAEKEGKKKPKKPTITEVENMIVPVDEQPYKLPDSWVWVRLENVVNLDNGESIENEELDYFDVKTLRGSKEIEKKDSGKVVEENDLVILVDGENSGEIFKIQYRGYMGSTFKKLKYKKEEMWNYISLFLRKNREVFKNSKIGSAIPHLNKKLFKELPFPLPPLEEQQEIVRILDEVIENENKVKELLELEERIDILEKSILHKAFKGELGTQNNNDVSAIELLKEII